MEGDDKKRILFKCALILNRFLEDNKLVAIQNEKAGKIDLTLVDNLSKVASSTGLRPASVSSIFNADSSPSTIHLILIINKLGYSLSEFGRRYESVAEDDLSKFKLQIANKKIIEKKRKMK